MALPSAFVTLSDHLLARFRGWEVRGRGWDLYEEPVELEPAFEPFRGHQVVSRFVDDGQRSTFLSSIAELFGRRKPPKEQVTEPEPECPAAQAAALPGQLSELRLLLPERFELPRDACEQLLLALGFCTGPVGFEIIGTAETVVVQMSVREDDLPHVLHQLQTFAPAASVLHLRAFLAEQWFAGPHPPLVVDLGLSEQFIRPLRTLRGFSVDPLASLIGALALASEGEIAVYQVLFEPARRPWEESVRRAVVDDDGKPFFAVGPDGLTLSKQKLAKPLYAVRARLAVQGASPERRLQLVRTIMGAVAQWQQPGSNELIALDGAGWDSDAQVDDLLFRSAHRTGMLLNVEELAALAHLPGAQVVHAKFERHTKRSKEAPALVRGGGVLLGVNAHAGRTVDVRLPADVRLRHTYVIGGTGTGKSTLLLNLILQDIEAGHGVAVLDPHGDLIDSITARIPEARAGDVVLISPADEEFPVGLNILTAHSEVEKTLLSSDLVSVFRRLSTSWGDQMNAVLGNALLAFLESTEGGTLLDLRRFLVEKEFRARFLSTVADAEVAYFWQKEFPQLKGLPAAPLLTRLDTFLRPRLIRNMVAQKRSLDFRALIDGRKIMLAKLSQGAIGEENAYLLGSLIVSKLHQVALSRADTDEQNRAGFHLYIDEFHHFITPSMSSLLSGVRKYRLGLTLAHQHLGQLGRSGDELVESVLTNAATRVCFRLGDADARRLAPGFSAFEGSDLQNLGVGEAIVRVERTEGDFNLRTLEVPEVDSDTARLRREAVLAASRATYATPKADLPQHLPPQPEIEPAPVATPEVRLPPIPPQPTVTQPTEPTPLSVPEITPRSKHSAGRGGQQHKYLQTLVKRFGEDRGFRASIEQIVLDGHGCVDVSLEREGLRVSVEITVTTPTAHELGNISKCLAAGYDLAVLVAVDQKAQRRLNAALGKALEPVLRERVRCVIPEEIPALLDDLSVPAPKREKVAGYTVNVRYAKPSEDERPARVQAVRDAMARSLRKLKGE